MPEINLTLAARDACARGAPARAVPSRCIAVSPTVNGARIGRLPHVATRGSRCLGTRLSVFCRVAAARADCRRRRARCFLQAAGRRPLSRARCRAIWRGRSRGVPVVLGSATPSLESYAQATRSPLSPFDASAGADPARDAAAARAGRAIVAPALTTALRVRCGTALRSLPGAWRARPRLRQSPRLLAVAQVRRACMAGQACPRCSAADRASRAALVALPPLRACRSAAAACPQCGNVDVRAVRLRDPTRWSARWPRRFRTPRIARVDRDSTRAKGAFAAIRAEVAIDAIDLLIGTQMLAKGHDFPRLTLVGVLGADNALYSADFRATERLAALLIQVAGRAGRAGLAGRGRRADRFSDASGLRSAQDTRLRPAGTATDRRA